eukprot:tig00020610_g12086.t1
MEGAALRKKQGNAVSALEFQRWVVQWELDASARRGLDPVPKDIQENKREERKKTVQTTVNFAYMDAMKSPTSTALLQYFRLCLDLALSEGVDVRFSSMLQPANATGNLQSPVSELYQAAEALFLMQRRVQGRKDAGADDEGDPGPVDEAFPLREASHMIPFPWRRRVEFRRREPPLSRLAQACRLGLRLTAVRFAASAPPSAIDEADAEGRTPLYHAVAFGPEMLDACAALIARGADAGRWVGEGTARRTVLQAHRDVAFRAALKRASGFRDTYICHGDAGGEAEFAAKLRDGLEAAHVTVPLLFPLGRPYPEERRQCLMRGSEGETGNAAPSGSEHLKRVGAVVFVASRASCSSERCRSELSAARALGRVLLPVWRERAELDDELQGFLLKQQFADFSTPELLASGLPAFALTVGVAASGGGAAASAAAEQLAALPESRCDVDSDAEGPFVFLWCCAADAAAAARVVRALSRRRVRCWTECSGAHSQMQDAPAGPGPSDLGARAAVRCAAFLPLLSPDSIGDPLLRDRVQLVELNKRPILPILPSEFPAPEDLPRGSVPFSFVTAGNVALLANLDRLFASVPGLAAGAAPPPPPSVAAPAEAARSPSEDEQLDLEHDLAERRRRNEQLEARVRERRASEAARGARAPPRAPVPVMITAPSIPRPAPSGSKACTVM